MLIKVISGGQTGVDQAALRAAKVCGLQTGGYAPKGYKTLDGNNPKLLKSYGLVETPSYSYRDRTALNVSTSDGTLTIARYFSSPGEILTRNLCYELDKPYFGIEEESIVFSNQPGKLPLNDWYNQIEQFIRDYGISTLNVAGNSQQTASGIYMTAKTFLIGVFKYVLA